MQYSRAFDITLRPDVLVCGGGLVAIAPRVVVDATGDADIAAWADAPPSPTAQPCNSKPA